MYINFELIISEEMTIQDFVTLQAIKQKDYVVAIEESVDKLIGLEYVSVNKDDSYGMTKKGTAFLKLCEIPFYTAAIEELVERVLSIYNQNSKKIGSQKKIRTDVAWYKKETNFKDDIIVKAVKRIFTKEDHKYIPNLENLFWKAPNVFSVQRLVEQSYIHKEMVQEHNLNVNLKLKPSIGNAYIWGIVKLKPPKRAKDLLFIDYEQDSAHIKKLKLIAYNKIWNK